jgi:hypothetical protein
VVVGLALALAGCGDGTAAVHLSPDAAKDVAQERSGDGAGDAVEADEGDVADDAAADADAAKDATPTADAASATDAGDAGADAATDVGVDASDGGDAPAEAPVDVAPEVAAKDAPADLPVEKPPATASWTIAPNPMCTAAGAGCMDTGAVGGYQITASGTCGVASSVQLWFPGGASPVAAGTYAVKTAAGILDVISMPAGMVGVAAERAPLKYWGRAGTVTVAVSGAGRRVTFSGVTLKDEASAATTTLGADVTCP